MPSTLCEVPWLASQPMAFCLVYRAVSQSKLKNISECGPGENGSNSEGQRTPGICPGYKLRGLVFQVPRRQNTEKRNIWGLGVEVKQDRIRKRG